MSNDITGHNEAVHLGACADAADARMGFNRILEKRALTPDTREFQVLNAEIASACAPGQFVIVRSDEKAERIPLTIADFDRKEGSITLVVQIVGDATMRLDKLAAGDAIRDIVGPLGHSSEIGKFGTVVLVGGGLGIAPVYPIQRAMREAGNRVVSIIGARSRNLVFWEDRMRATSDEFYLATDDGTAGEKGFVTDILRRVIGAAPKPDRVIAIGPPVMMKAVAEVTRAPGIKTIVSLNPIMVDGTGMCGGCRVQVGNQTKFACVDGPEFDAHEVDFALLTSRLATYREVEKRAREQHGAA